REAGAIREAEQVVVREERTTDGSKRGGQPLAYARVERAARYTRGERPTITQDAVRGGNRRTRLGELIQTVPDRNGVEAFVAVQRFQCADARVQATTACEPHGGLVDVDAAEGPPVVAHRGKVSAHIAPHPETTAGASCDSCEPLRLRLVCISL